MTDQQFPLFEKATQYAAEHHAAVNQLYDGQPYADSHLKMVDEVIMKFIHLIPFKDRDLVRAGGQSHDLIEDARVIYNDIVQALGKEVADIAYACSNEKGHIRPERANRKYYSGIRETQYADFVKYADRIANVKYSKEHGGLLSHSMLQGYKKEHRHFICNMLPDSYSSESYYEGETAPPPYAEMIDELCSLFGLPVNNYNNYVFYLKNPCHLTDGEITDLLTIIYPSEMGAKWIDFEESKRVSLQICSEKLLGVGFDFLIRKELENHGSMATGKGTIIGTNDVQVINGTIGGVHAYSAKDVYEYLDFINYFERSAEDFPVNLRTTKPTLSLVCDRFVVAKKDIEVMN